MPQTWLNTVGPSFTRCSLKMDGLPLGPAEQSGEPPPVGDAAAERACNVPATPKQFFSSDGFSRLHLKEKQSLLEFHKEWRNLMTRTKLLSASLFAAAMLAAPAMARESYVTSRHLAEDANASASPTARHFDGHLYIPTPRAHASLPAPRTGKIAMSAITRLYAEVGSALSAEMRLSRKPNPTCGAS